MAPMRNRCSLCFDVIPYGKTQCWWHPTNTSRLIGSLLVCSVFFMLLGLVGYITK